MCVRMAGAAALLALLAGCSSAPGPAREQFLNLRNSLRLYDGAPPVIPHAVGTLGREDCSNCHTPGAYENADRVAPPRSHPAFGDCRQCHVERRASTVFQANTIQPLRWPANGHRQSEISPPMIPHHIQNREDCVVCHVGAQAPAPIRAKHGFRSECRQCHVAMQSAER